LKYLLDTNIFLWSNGAPEKLNRQAVTILSSVSSEIYLSAASSWEIAIKFALRTLRLPSPPSQFIPDTLRILSIRSLQISHFHALAAGALPPHHRDPFDRMLIAQAGSEEMVLLTADKIFAKYDVEMLFCGN